MFISVVRVCGFMTLKADHLKVNASKVQVNLPPLDCIQEVLVLWYGVAAKLLIVYSEAILPQPHHHLHLE